MNTNSNAADLTKLWERTYPDDPFDEFAFDDRLLYLLCNSSLRVLDAADGHEVRSKEMSWTAIRSQPRFWGEYIFIPADVQKPGASLDRVYALHAETGIVKWYRPLDSSPHTYLTLLGDHVFCGSANTLHGFHRESGVPLSPLAIDPQITCPRRPRGLGLPFVAYPSSIIPYNNLLFVGAGQFIIAVDPGTLTEVARYQMEGGEVLRFLIVGSILYVGTGNYDDMCFRLTAYALPS